MVTALKNVHFIASYPCTVRSRQKVWSAVHGLIKGSGLQYELTLTAAPGDAMALARRAAESGASMVVAAGGDGTVHEVVNGLMQADVSERPALGIVPLGTGNDFYRALVFGTNEKICPKDAIRRIQQGALRPLDLGLVRHTDRRGRANQVYFNNGMSLGLAAAVTRTVERWNRWMTGTWPYLGALGMNLARWRNQKVHFEVDGRPVDARVFSLNVTNGRFYGGGMVAAPKADMGDGWLDVVLMNNFSHADVIRYMPNNYNGDFDSIPKLQSWRARHVSITAPAPIYIQTDGEFVGSTPAEVNVVPAALQLVF